jgi:anionic cell wall polymer biosynthesis LytR-Cps2A-Psr (LCP) family protein
MATLGLVTGLTLLLGIFLWKTFRSILVPSSSSAQNTTENAPNEPAKPTSWSVALLGYGGNGHAGGLLTDTIIVAYVQPDEKTITLITLPRDLWVHFPSGANGETGWKLNAAYPIGSDDRGYPNKPAEFKGETGGGALAKYAIQKVVGFPIDSFVAVSFDGFIQSVDILGGLNVHVEKTFDDYWYPLEGEEENTCGRSPEDIVNLTATVSGYLLEQQFPCRYEKLHFDKGLTQMDGEVALKYARSRHSSQDGSDFARSQRQKQVILAAREKMLSLNVVTKFIPLLNSLGKNLRTDLSIEELQNLLAKKDEYRDYTIQSIALTDKNVLVHGRSSNGQYILMPAEGEEKWDNLHAWIQQQIADPQASVSGEFAE